MKNIVIVNLIEIYPFFYEKIDGLSQIDRIQNYIKTLPEVEEVFVLLKKEIEIPYKKIIKDIWNEEIFMDCFENITNGYDHLFYFFGDMPLIDSKLSLSMFHDHNNFYAEYTFADGYPYGLTPEIIDIGIIKALSVLAKGSTVEIKRDTIFNIVKKDINSFELETKIAKNDQRLKRISLTTDTKRNFNQLKRIIEKGGNDADSITHIIDTQSEILFQEPSYISLEISKIKAQPISYLPNRVVKDDFMDITTLDIVLQKIKEYSDDATVAFTPEYEPTKHPSLLEVIQMITVKYEFNLYIETSGLGWTKRLKDEIISNPRTFVIVTLDATDPKIYHELRGNGQAEAEAFSKEIIDSMKERVWVQATRMKSNEINMEPFYRYWQEFTDQIIIQKYSNYNGRLPDLKIADLSPLNRFPCWHLKRDLHVNTEGNVLLCFNDIDGEIILGSLVSEDIEVIMNKKREYYLKHINCEYTNICRNCDEYYTFNF